MKDKIQQFLQQMKEQEWYQQLQNTYQQLSPEQQSYLKWGSFSAGVILSFYFTFSIVQSSNSIKDEYFQKQELVQTLNQGSDEIRRLKGQSSGFTQSASTKWITSIQSLVTAQGLQPDAVEILKESPGISQNVIQETLLEVQVKGISVRPLVQLLFQMEHAQPPMKLKGINVESGTGDGLLNAKLNLSGYLAKTEPKGEKNK